MNLSKIYGPVVGDVICRIPFISVCGYDAVKEALHNPDLYGRIDLTAMPIVHYILSGLKGEWPTLFDDWLIFICVFFFVIGLLFSDGSSLHEQRQFAIRQLSSFGYGRTSSENLIQEEICDLIKVIRIHARNLDGVVDFSGIFHIPMINSQWAFFANERFKHDDPNLKKLTDAFGKFPKNNILFLLIPIPRFMFRLFRGRPFFDQLLTILKYPLKFVKGLHTFIQVLHWYNDLLSSLKNKFLPLNGRTPLKNTNATESTTLLATL